MRRSLVALSVSLLTLFALVGPVSADWPSDPGTYKHLAMRYTECADESCNPVVIDQFVSANLQPDGSAEVCATVDTAGSFETGCTSVDASIFGTHRSFIVAVPPTEVELHAGSPEGAVTRTVTVSLATALAGSPVRETIDGTFPDGNCTVRFSGKRSTADVTGTLTMDDDARAAQDGVTSITVVQTRTKCPKP